MKNNNSFYIISGILGAAIIALFILQFASNSNGKGASSHNFIVSNDSSATLPVAYVRIDSLLINYNYAKDMNEALMRKEESSRATLNQKERQFQAAAQEFQRKVQNNAFLNQERYDQEQRRIMNMQQDYQQTAERLTQEFALEQQKLNIELEDTIKVRLVEFNKNKGYQIIYSNTGSDNILYADDKYDITKEVIDFLNAKYGPATSASTATTTTESAAETAETTKK